MFHCHNQALAVPAERNRWPPRSHCYTWKSLARELAHRRVSEFDEGGPCVSSKVKGVQLLFYRFYIHSDVYSCIFIHISIKMYKVYCCFIFKKNKNKLLISPKPSMFCHGDVELHPFFEGRMI